MFGVPFWYKILLLGEALNFDVIFQTIYIKIINNMKNDFFPGTFSIFAKCGENMLYWGLGTEPPKLEKIPIIFRKTQCKIAELKQFFKNLMVFGNFSKTQE